MSTLQQNGLSIARDPAKLACAINFNRIRKHVVVEGLRQHSMNILGSPVSLAGDEQVGINSVISKANRAFFGHRADLISNADLN